MTSVHICPGSPIGRRHIPEEDGSAGPNPALGTEERIEKCLSALNAGRKPPGQARRAATPFMSVPAAIRGADEQEVLPGDPVPDMPQAVHGLDRPPQARE